MSFLCILLLVGCVASIPLPAVHVTSVLRLSSERESYISHHVNHLQSSFGPGYCQQLTPEWEKLAGAVKGTVKIAYWDTEQQSRPPALLGEIKGTPTIRLFVPKKKQGDSNAKKVVLDYQYERKAVAMKRWIDSQMPDFVEKISSGIQGLNQFQDKAVRHGLPQVLLFTSKPQTLPLTKYLSTEFRRRLLIGEIHPTKPNKEIMEQFGITDLPALIVIPAAGEEEGAAEPIRYQGNGGFSKNKLHSFLSKHALQEKVFPAKKTKPDPEEKPSENVKKEKEEPKKKVKVGSDGEL